MFACVRAQPQAGERVFETKTPVIGLFVSFNRSVTANAAAVAMSRPTIVAVERNRCKAWRFYAARLSGNERTGLRPWLGPQA